MQKSNQIVFNLSGDIIIATNYDNFRKKLFNKLETKLASIKKSARLLQSFDDYLDVSLYRNIQYELKIFCQSIINDDIEARLHFGIMRYKTIDVNFDLLIECFCRDIYNLNENPKERFLN